MRPVAARASALAACVLVATSCAFPPVVPVDFIQPIPVPDGSVEVGSLRISARSGPEWIELRVRNTGETTATIDWDASAFVTPAGHFHRVVSSDRLLNQVARQAVYWPLGGMDFHGNPGMTFGAAPVAAQEAPTHSAPAWLDAIPVATALIAPRVEHSVVLYPAEHIVLSPHGFFVTPLICEGGGRPNAPFMLMLRVTMDGVGQNVELRARLRDSATYAGRGTP